MNQNIGSEVFGAGRPWTSMVDLHSPTLTDGAAGAHGVDERRAAVASIAFQNQRVVYDILFRTAAATLKTIAADPVLLEGLQRLADPVEGPDWRRQEPIGDGKAGASFQGPAIHV